MQLVKASSLAMPKRKNCILVHIKMSVNCLIALSVHRFLAINEEDKGYLFSNAVFLTIDIITARL